MPSRTKADHDEIVRVYSETKSGRETARRVGVHPNTVYQVLRLHRGKCRICANDVLPGHSYCASCLEHLRTKEKADRKDRVRVGLCVLCDTPRDPLSRLYCAEHRIQHLEASERSYAQQKATRAAAGGIQTDSERERAYKWRYGDEAVAVFRRLEGRCVLCSVHYQERAVHIHHIDEDQTNNAEENFTLLCQHCHRLVHSVIGHPNPVFALAWIRATYPQIGI